MPTPSPTVARPILRVELLEDRQLLHGFSALAFHPHSEWGNSGTDLRPSVAMRGTATPSVWGREPLGYLVIITTPTFSQTETPHQDARNLSDIGTALAATTVAAAVSTPKSPPVTVAAQTVALPLGPNTLTVDNRVPDGQATPNMLFAASQDFRQPSIRLDVRSFGSVREGGEDVPGSDAKPASEPIIVAAPSLSVPSMATPPTVETLPAFFAPESAGLIASGVASGLAALERVFASPDRDSASGGVPWNWLGVGAWAAGVGVAYAAARRGRSRTLIEELS